MFSRIAKPLEERTGKYVRFEWNKSRQQAFETLKLDAPVLRFADTNQDFRVETDASDFALTGVLLQQANDQSWHPVSYVSPKLSLAEQNYTAAERDLGCSLRLTMVAAHGLSKTMVCGRDPRFTFYILQGSAQHTWCGAENKHHPSFTNRWNDRKC